MLIKELIPELDNEQFQQLVSDVSNTLSVEEFGARSGSESIVRLSAPASMTLGSASEPFMFHALFTNLIGHERDHVRQTIQNFEYAGTNRLEDLVNLLTGELTERLLNFYMRPFVAHIKKISAQGLLRGKPLKNGMKNGFSCCFADRPNRVRSGRERLHPAALWALSDSLRLAFVYGTRS